MTVSPLKILEVDASRASGGCFSALEPEASS